MPRNLPGKRLFTVTPKLEVELVQSLAGIEPDDWNALGEADYPFTRHAFLYALEQHHCLLEYGWQPVFFLLYREQKLIAAAPSYIKTNSYGELVFDHSWAQAYQQSGRHYYPKLVTAIPYTPASGPRLLVHRELTDKNDVIALQSQLIRVIKQFCTTQDLSGWHLLFERETTAKSLQQEQLVYRYDCQYHWHNRDYASFDDFLAALSSRKRKNIRKERASVANEDISIERHHGDELSSQEWRRVHELYAGIFDRKYGTPTLSADFFEAIGSALKQQVMVVLARRQQHIVAVSLFFSSDSTLYGRVWGCDEFYNHLHFECCYYQGIEHCIEQGLQHFDPGAQGEHKISRGFLPTRTCSAHWLVDSQFQQMIHRFLQQEEQYIHDYCEELTKRSPYRNEDAE